MIRVLEFGCREITEELVVYLGLKQTELRGPQASSGLHVSDLAALSTF